MKKTLSLTALALLVGTTSANAGDSESCKAVRFADVGWTDIQVTTGISAGCARVDEIQRHRCVFRQLDAVNDSGNGSLQR